MSLQNIRAGGATWEASVVDKTGPGLARAQSKLKAFAAGLRSLASPLRAISHAFAVVGAGILTPLAAAAKTFMELGRAMGNQQAKELSATWKELRTVFTSIAFVTGEALAPVLKVLGQVLITAGLAVARFIKTHPMLIALMFAAGVVATALAVAFGGLALAVTAVAGAIFLLDLAIAPATIAIVAATAAAVVFAGTALLVATHWNETKAVVVTAFEAMAIAANTASQQILDAMQRAFDFVGLGRLAAIAGVAKGVMKQAEGPLSVGLAGKGIGALGQLAGLGAFGEGFGVAGTRSGAAVGRVGPSSISRVSDPISHQRLKEILDELKKPAAGAKFD